MAKKDLAGRKSGPAAGSAASDVAAESQAAAEETASVAPVAAAPTTKLKEKAKEDTAGGAVAVGEIRKAAAFANSVGGLDKALALLQILKVAKEVQ